MTKTSNRNKEISFEIKNWGPHSSINTASKKIEGVKLGCFAKNGEGKTFLSRAFRLFEEQNSKNSDELLSFRETNGYFKFGFDDEYYSVEINKGQNPSIETGSNSNLIFHVFNSDFVLKNILKNEYKFDDKIQGYIIGESTVKLTELKEELQDLKNKQQTLEKNLSEYLEEVKQDLKNEFNINHHLKEMKDISLENLDGNISKSIEELGKSLLKYSTYYKISSDMPDDLEDIKYPSSPNFIELRNIFTGINQLLSEHFSAAKLDNNTLSFYVENHEFISKGLQLLDNKQDICPFCKQKVNETLPQIEEYKKYKNDKLYDVIENINKCKNRINNFKGLVSEYETNWFKFERDFDKIKRYLPNFNKNLIVPNNDKIRQLLNDSLDFLNNIPNTTRDLTISSEINKLIDKENKIYDNNRERVQSLNDNKNNIKDYQKSIQREICKIKFELVKSKKENDIKENERIKKEIQSLENRIEEGKHKVNKKDEVIKSFKHFLNFFFADKYTFDSENFFLRFEDEFADNNVLSEGEQSIVAFCYYLATTHLLVNKSSDYNRLFFIIDDPISSLDYNYSYAFLTVISNVKEHFKHMKKELRYVIFTHDIYFMNTMIKNNYIKHSIFLTKNSMEFKKKKEFFLIYEEHLNDIIEIYKEKSKPSHTTPNSLRQILEHIMHFESKYTNLKAFIENDDILKKNKSIYILINDLSHSNSNHLQLYSDELKKCCFTVIEYIKKIPSSD